MVGDCLLAHSIVLGRFLDWRLKQGRLVEVAAPWDDFRAAKRSQAPYMVAFLVQFAAGSGVLASALLGAVSLPAAIAARAPFSMLVALRSPTGFDRLEAGLLFGRPGARPRRGLDPAGSTAPIHVADAAVYLGAAVAVAALDAPA